MFFAFTMRCQKAVSLRCRASNSAAVPNRGSAPGGATVLGSAIRGPPGCESGAAGSWNCYRSRPGKLLPEISARAGSDAVSIAIAIAIAAQAMMQYLPGIIPTPLTRTPNHQTILGLY